MLAPDLLASAALFLGVKGMEKSNHIAFPRFSEL